MMYRSSSNPLTSVGISRRKRIKRKGIKALVYRLGRILRNMKDQPLASLSMIVAVTVGVSIAIAIIAASDGIEKQITALLGTHSSMQFTALGINIHTIHQLLQQTRDLLTKLAIGFTAALVALVTLAAARQRHRDFSLKRLEGEHFGELILEQLVEALFLCITGGWIGVGLGLELCSIISRQIPLLPMSPSISAVITIFPYTTLLSFSVTAVIAALFAFFPRTEPTD